MALPSTAPRVRTAVITGTLDVALGSGDTTIESVALADLPVIPGPTGADYAAIILDPRASAGRPECVYVTAHADGATTATITRGEETEVGHGPARAHGTSTTWMHVPTPYDYGYAALPRGPRVVVPTMDPRTVTATIENGSNILTLAEPGFTLADWNAGLAGDDIPGGTTIDGDPTDRTTATMTAAATADATIDVTITPVRATADLGAVQDLWPGASYLVLLGTGSDEVVTLLPHPGYSAPLNIALSAGDGGTPISGAAPFRFDSLDATYVLGAGPDPDPDQMVALMAAWPFPAGPAPEAGWGIVTLIPEPPGAVAPAGLDIYTAPWSESYDAMERQSQSSFDSNVATFVDNYVSGWFITPERDQYIDGLQLELVTLGGSGAEVRVGIYEVANGEATGAPLVERVIDADTSTASVGHVYDTFDDPILLEHGKAYMAVAAASDDDVELRAPDQLPGIPLGSWQAFANFRLTNSAGWTYGSFPAEGSDLNMVPVHNGSPRPHIIWHLATAP